MTWFKATEPFMPLMAKLLKGCGKTTSSSSMNDIFHDRESQIYLSIDI